MYSSLLCIPLHVKRDIGDAQRNLVRNVCLFLLFANLATSFSFPDKNSELSSYAGYNNPCLGRASRGGVEYYVIGTSHFQSRSAEDVRSLILDIEPDGVVIELDAERTIRLTKEQCISDINSDSSKKKEKFLYGGDFLAAIDISQELDIPLFLGDEAPKTTLARLIETATVWETYNPAVLSNFLKSTSTSSSQKINFFHVFLSDPWKVRPLLLTLPSILALLFSFQHYQLGNILTNVETFTAILISLFATSKVFNVLIVDRDEILSFNAIRASKVIDSLRKKETIRKRWMFTVDNIFSNKIEKEHDGDEFTPIFTLKTRLDLGQNRNLNLFEPRWLHMIDCLSNNLQLHSDLKQPPYPQFVAVPCPNKFYSCVAINGVEGRYADIIFSKEGNMATLLKTREGRRPSGDRRISCLIEGGEKVAVDEMSIQVKSEGYMVITESKEDKRNKQNNVEKDKKSEANVIKIVVIAGLLHANGIIDRLSQ